jgi:hypothetical protein
LTTGIGTRNEKPLHEALKRWYAQPGDSLEMPVDGFVVDIVRGSLLIEIQTRNFSAIKKKLEKLAVNHAVRLVYPIPYRKWIIKSAGNGKNQTSRRKSPKQGDFTEVFRELIRIPDLITHPHFSMELLLIEEEEVRHYDGVRGWRRGGWVTDEHRLLQVVDRLILNEPRDLSNFLPDTMIEPFSVADLAKAINKSRGLAQKMVYCLRSMGCLEAVGKKGNAILYSRQA